MENHLLKMSAAGNRFLIADRKWFKNKPPLEWRGYSVKTKKSFEDFLQLFTLSFSKRRAFMENLISDTGLSLTDGLVVLKQSEKFIFACDFYNKDGSKAEMCGNAACCMSVYANWMSFPLGAFRLGREIVSCTANGGIALRKAPGRISDHKFTFNGKSAVFSLVKHGVPHGVIECPIEGLADFKNKLILKEIAQNLRFKNPEDDKGMNVSFFQVDKQDRLKAITYERGVEDFTLACGTGALAVAFVYLHKSQTENLKTIFVKMPGAELRVQFEPQISLFSPVKRGY